MPKHTLLWYKRHCLEGDVCKRFDFDRFNRDPPCSKFDEKMQTQIESKVNYDLFPELCSIEATDVTAGKVK